MIWAAVMTSCIHDRLSANVTRGNLTSSDSRGDRNGISAVRNLDCAMHSYRLAENFVRLVDRSGDKQEDGNLRLIGCNHLSMAETRSM